MEKKKKKNDKPSRIVIEEVDESRLRKVSGGGGPGGDSGSGGSQCQCVCGGPFNDY